MSVARHGASQPQVPRLIAEVASASAPAGTEPRHRPAFRCRRRRRRQRAFRFRKCTRPTEPTGESFRGIGLVRLGTGVQTNAIARAGRFAVALIGVCRPSSDMHRGPVPMQSPRGRSGADPSGRSPCSQPLHGEAGEVAVVAVSWVVLGGSALVNA